MGRKDLNRQKNKRTQAGGAAGEPTSKDTIPKRKKKAPPKRLKNKPKKQPSSFLADSLQQVYDYVNNGEWMSAILSSTPFVVSRQVLDEINARVTTQSWTMVSSSSSNCSSSVLPVEVMPFLDTNQDGMICPGEVFNSLFLWKTHCVRALLGGDVEDNDDDETWMWRVVGFALIALAVLSVVPGRFHTWSARMLRWPVLGYTYLLIMVELTFYILVRSVIYLGEVILPQSHASIRRARNQASSYEEWYMYSQTLDETEPYRMAWLERLDDSTSQAYNWNFIQLLIQDMQASRKNNEDGDLLPALAVIQQCTRQNVGGIMSAELFSYSYTGEPKRIVTQYMEEVVLTLSWIAEQATKSTASSRGGVETNGKDPRPKLDQELKEVWKSFVGNFVDKQAKEKEGITTPNRSIRTADVASPPDSQQPHEATVLRLNRVLLFLKRARASYGRTALVLSGGASVGVYHMGIVRGLLRHGTLPRIISGTSAGSLCAALVCTRTNEELELVLSPEVLVTRMNIFERSTWERLVSAYQTGCIFSYDDWKTKFQWMTNGDMTFEEAFQKTGRVLCITVSSTTKKAPPVLLNHISAPNVTIVSAVLASCAVPGCIPAVRLQYKDATTGEIRRYGDDDQTFIDGSVQQDIPTKGLAEMLNCQFFITSQVNPHINPFFFNQKGAIGRPTQWSSGQEQSWRGGFLLAALEMYLKYEMKAKFQFLHDVEAAVGFTSTMMAQSFKGSVNMVPELAFSNVFKILTDPDLPRMHKMFQVGEITAYEHISFIKHQYAIPDALDACIHQLEQCVAGGSLSSSTAKDTAGTEAVSTTTRGTTNNNNDNSKTTPTRKPSVDCISLFPDIHSSRRSLFNDDCNNNNSTRATIAELGVGVGASNGDPFEQILLKETKKRSSVVVGGRGKRRTSEIAGINFGTLDLFDDDDDFEPIIPEAVEEKGDK